MKRYLFSCLLLLAMIHFIDGGRQKRETKEISVLDADKNQNKRTNQMLDADKNQNKRTNQKKSIEKDIEGNRINQLRFDFSELRNQNTNQTNDIITK
ncbi:hypothetical protein KSF78_0008837 [Schistosoma japonicum]|nr:hypothetical protein KSF78_0008837 [Schistosoma japonicum]